MKVFGIFIVAIALAACATTTPPTAVASEYTAERLPDGSIRIIVTGIADAPKRYRKSQLDLGAMLKDAASKECPSGYELSEDPVPVVRSESDKLIATMGGIARCS